MKLLRSSSSDSSRATIASVADMGDIPPWIVGIYTQAPSPSSGRWHPVPCLRPVVALLYSPGSVATLSRRCQRPSSTAPRQPAAHDVEVRCRRHARRAARRHRSMGAARTARDLGAGVRGVGAHGDVVEERLRDLAARPVLGPQLGHGAAGRARPTRRARRRRPVSSVSSPSGVRDILSSATSPSCHAGAQHDGEAARTVDVMVPVDTDHVAASADAALDTGERSAVAPARRRGGQARSDTSMTVSVSYGTATSSMIRSAWRTSNSPAWRNSTRARATRRPQGSSSTAVMAWSSSVVVIPHHSRC